MKVIYAALPLLISLNSACGALPNRMGPERISEADISNGNAIVIVSAGAPSACTSTGTNLEFKSEGTRYTGSTVAYMPVDFSIVKSDFTDHHGFLHTFKLAPGNYYMTTSVANAYVKGIKVPKYDFSVSAGEIIYLGEYYMTVSCVWTPVASMRDQEQRDVAILKSKNPAFLNKKITKRIPLMSGYAIGGDQ
ncbi:hypothetical protein [Nevskia ramosa]|uniref:hypothetical protein n=1 Tax=Nevskia ramosa TaxID=64002 RepID=UPI003D0F754B